MALVWLSLKLRPGNCLFLPPSAVVKSINCVYDQQVVSMWRDMREIGVVTARYCRYLAEDL